MKKNTSIVRSAMSLPAFLLGVGVLSGLFLLNKQEHTRQYSSSIKINADKDKDAGAGGMEQFFFNARKNNVTGMLDFGAMIDAANEAIRGRQTHRTLGTLGLNWHSMGPSNIGGRVRAIMVSNTDPTGLTVFAGGVSGGLWRSKNGGASWDSINDNWSNLMVSCITQTPGGDTIYVGTGEGFSVYSYGEGFSTGMLGGGIFKSTDGGNTFSQLSSTTPSSSNSVGATWAYTNRVAVNPKNPSVVYAGTNQGIEESFDGGNTWTLAQTGGTCLDLKVSWDGSEAFASVNGNGYYLYPQSGDNYQDKAWTKIPFSGYGSLPQTSGGRIEFAISPKNPNFVYASCVNPGAGTLKGIYFTMSGQTGGGKWYVIGPGGSKAFDPYSSGGVQDQGDYDNTMAVFPNNQGEILVGGTTLWSWGQLSPTDTVGSWTSISRYFSFFGDP